VTAPRPAGRRAAGALAAVLAAGVAPTTRPPPVASPQQQPATAGDRAALAAFLDTLRREHDLPAVAAGVVTSDGAVAAAVGSRRLGGPANVTDADRFHVGSNGKAMTAGLVGRLVEEGRLALDAPLPALFPELAPRMHAAWRPATLRDLLTHTSGLAENPEPDAWRSAPAHDARAQRAAVAVRALTRPPAGPRGRYAYSNLGYILAGAAAERAADQAFEPLLLARVLAPLGVTTAGFGAPGTPGRDDQPLGHRTTLLVRRAAVEPGPGADNPPVFSPAGRVHLSAGDYARFVQAVLAGARGRDGVVRAATLRALLADRAPADPPGARYAAGGWLVVQRPWARGDAYTHAGSTTLNFAVVWMAPGRDLAVFAAVNQGGRLAPAAADAIVKRLLVRRLAAAGR
jgi:CubicO group peptidase (beta-lactamase class C family)